MRVRYDTYCDGRLLKVTGRVDVTEAGHAQRDGTDFIDGQHWWMVDEQVVADDVAQAMLAEHDRKQQNRDQ